MSDSRPVFCGNFEYDATVRDVERLFDEFGPIDRVDMKSGFAFVFMKDSRDGDDAIQQLDGMEFGRRRRPLRVEWAKGEGETKRREDKRRKHCTPTDTLFVVNFDPETTGERDLERHFAPYGKLKRVQVKRNYGFVHFQILDDATAARNGLNLSRLQDRTITVEYVARDPNGRSWDEGNAPQSTGDGQGRNYQSPPRRRSRSPDYGGSRQRSHSNGRQKRNRSITPSRRHRRSPSPVRQKSDRSGQRVPSKSHPRRRSSSLSGARSISPKHTRSRSPTTIAFQDANSRAASKSRSRSPGRPSSSPASSR